MIVRLSQDSWHFKLQEWTFGEVPIKDNLCPYFWLTVFCIVAIPFALIIKSMMVLVELVSLINWSWFKWKRKPKPYISNEVQKKKRRAWFMKIADYTKALVPIGIVLLLSGGCYALYVNWESIFWLEVFKVIGIVVMFFFGVTLVIFIVPPIFGFLIIKPLKGVFTLLWYVFKAAKDGYCPVINWGDK